MVLSRHSARYSFRSASRSASSSSVKRRSLASRADARTLLANYVDASRLELCGDAPVLGRMKELLSYWCLEPGWNRLWPSIKMCRSLDELILCCR